MSKTAYDQYIDADEEEETCPLCIEDFDLTDKGFKPCPCGYQICQFCYNSIKNNMNGLCPACRRVYDDKQIEYKVITAEETAAYKARQAQKQKKTQAALQKEKQKAEADSLSRKHLAGLRVVQKNLVYVTGIAPKMQEDELLQTLRGDKYFGQYGKIIKIVVSKARDKHDSVGVYVTYEHKDDAASCIAAVDGTTNGDRTLRAQFGTTKYCSAYLRGDTCMNRNCMFLHEPGEAKDSYSRADLSALNAGSTQNGESRPPPPQSQQPLAAQPMARQGSDQPASPVLPDRPALPSTASWASKPTQRAESRAPSSIAESPAPVPAIPADTVRPVETQPAKVEATVLPKRLPSAFSILLHDFDPKILSFIFDPSSITSHDLALIEQYPALFDLDGGTRRRLRNKRDREAQSMIEETQETRFQVEGESNMEGAGSSQLGGDPEDNVQGITRGYGDDQSFGGDMITPAGLTERGMTPQEHQRFLLETMKSTTPQSGHAPGHQRNVSRFSFANDTSASTAVKPVANAKAMNQQNAMMPPQASYNQQSQFFTSNVQGPPPGLKTTGTPPASGGMIFGQGHGFTTGGLPFTSANANRNQNDEMLRGIMRGRGADAASKLDEDFPPLGPARQASISSLPPGLQNDSTRRSTPVLPPGLEDSISRRQTPTIPPGLSENEVKDENVKPTALPDLGGASASRPSSRAGVKRIMSTQIVPVIPLRSGTPAKNSSRPGTPARLMSRTASPARKSHEVVHETPTKQRNDQDSAADMSAVVDAVLKSDAEQTKAEVVEDVTSAAISRPTTVTTASDAFEGPSTSPAQASRNDLDLSKRQHPGKLDITAAVKQAAEEITSSATESPIEAGSTSKRTVSRAPSIKSVSSAVASVASPQSKPAPRTLRVVQTPKAETPPPAPVVITALASANARKLPSRQPSIASMNLPGTPTSEHVSIPDTGSITSASRANTPPPVSSVVGSAPVRSQTKSQVKKQRQERAKALEESKVETTKAPAATEAAQEAIIGRKKKSKKDKEVKPKSKFVKDVIEHADEATPTVFRPISPIATTPAPVEKVEPIAEAPSPQVVQEPMSPDNTSFSPAQLIAELKALDPNTNLALEALLRVPSTTSGKNLPPITQVDMEAPISWRAPNYGLSTPKEIVERLLSGEPLRWSTGPQGRVWSRGVVTPGGAQLRALGEELEQRYIELEKQVMDLPEELRFRPTKPQNEIKFPAFDLKVLKRNLNQKGVRGVSVMEQMVQDGSPMKKGAFLVDEASRYINEFVMPPINLPNNTHGGNGQQSQAQQQQQQAHIVQNVVQSEQGTMPMPSMEIIERQLAEAKKAVEERESALKRVIRKNKKLLGLG